MLAEGLDVRQQLIDLGQEEGRAGSILPPLKN